LTSHAEAKKRKKKRKRKRKRKVLWLQMASNRLMDSSRIRTRKERHMRKSKRWKGQRKVRSMKKWKRRKRSRSRSRRLQSQMKKKTNYPHPLKPIPQSFPCQSRARLQALRRPKGP